MVKQRKHINVEEWEPSLKEKIVTYDGKLIIVPFDKLFNRASMKEFNTFIIKQKAYVGKLELICKHINYFCNFYDPERELITAYLKLKHKIDLSTGKLSEEAFIARLYHILFTPSIVSKITQMVEDNYIFDIDSDSSADKYPDETKFTDEHTKILFSASTAIKLMVPVVFHYINSNNIHAPSRLYNYYERVLHLFHTEQVNLYNKLWIWCLKKVENDYNVHKVLWEQREVYGETIITRAVKLFKSHIIVDTLFKYTFDGNPNVLNAVVVKKQLRITNGQKYKHNLVAVSNERSGEGNELKRIEMMELTASKIDESLIVLSPKNIKRTISRIQDEMQVRITEDEYLFYNSFTPTNSIQKTLVDYHYAKYFNGFLDLNMISKRQYMTLLILLKKKLQYQKFKYLPQILTGEIVGKIQNRSIRNMKFLNKLKSTPLYNKLVSEKFAYVYYIKKNDPIIEIVSSLLNTKFKYVDFNNLERCGTIIEVNQDTLSDEILNFLNQI